MQWDNYSTLSIGPPPPPTATTFETLISEEESAGYGGYIAYSERLETYLVPVVLGIIFLVGLIGNGGLICIFFREPSVRSSVPNTFILNLALGDLLVLFCSVPFTSTIYTLESWPYGEFVCKASEFAKDTSVGVSVFTLTVLSLDRYTAIARPVQSFANGPRSKLSVVASLGFIWVFAITLATPALFFAELKVTPVPFEHLMTIDGIEEASISTVKNITICYPFPERFGPTYPKVIVLARFLIHYLIPLFIITTLYAIIARHLLKSTETLPGEATVTVRGTQRRMTNQGLEGVDQLPYQTQSRRKVAKTVLSFVVLFAICFLPFHIFIIWFYYDPDSLEHYNTFWHTLKIVGFCMAYTNSSLNPIAMYCISTSFRHYFHRLFCCCRPNNLNKDGSLSRGRPQGINSEIRGEPAGAKLPGTEPVPAFRGRIHSVPVLGRGKKPLLKSSSNTGCLRPHHSETRVSSSHLKEDPLPSPPV